MELQKLIKDQINEREKVSNSILENIFAIIDLIPNDKNELSTFKTYYDSSPHKNYLKLNNLSKKRI